MQPAPATKANISGTTITNVPQDVQAAFKTLTEALSQITDRTDQMYCTGGFVRDIVLGIPFHDIDITLQEKYFDKYISVVKALPGVTGYSADYTAGEEFNGQQVELIRFELNGISFDLKRASFKPDMEGDILKRDFTVNALYINPFTWQIHDPRNYLPDVYNRVLRGVNAYSIIFIDRNRIIRTVRFRWKGFTYDPALEQYLETGAKQYMRDAKDPSDLQRLGGELRKCFSCKQHKEILTELISRDLLRFLCVDKQILLKSIEVITLAKDLLLTDQWKTLSQKYLKQEAKEADEMRLIIHLYLSYFLRLSSAKMIPRSTLKRIGICFLRLCSLTEVVRNHKKLVRVSLSQDLKEMQLGVSKYLESCGKSLKSKILPKDDPLPTSELLAPSAYAPDDPAFRAIDVMQLGLLVPFETLIQLKM